MCNINEKSYNVWFLRYGLQQFFLSFWTIFCLFTPLTTQKIKILKKWKKKSLEISSFYTSVINDHEWSYATLWMIICYNKNYGCNFYFSFWDIFALSHPLPSPYPAKKPKKSFFLKKWKKCLHISSFYTCVANIKYSWIK